MDYIEADYGDSNEHCYYSIISFDFTFRERIVELTVCRNAAKHCSKNGRKVVANKEW